jgi:methylglutaconyl-CoA hydratase
MLHVRCERGVTTLTVDSPHNRNALSSALLAELDTALARAVADPAVRVVLLSHTGTVFCSGADLTETTAATASDRLPVEAMADLIAALWECPKPVVARVGGAARAGGIGLVAAADIAICAADATFAFTEVRLGVVPAVISATVLRRLHPRAAAEFYLTGDVFDGTRAEAAGLVTAAVPADVLDPTVAAYCDALVRGGPAALAGTTPSGVISHNSPHCRRVTSDRRRDGRASPPGGSAGTRPGCRDGGRVRRRRTVDRSGSSRR